jgi:Phosphotransferase enzyme family
MAHPRLPLSLEEITPEWLSDAFSTRYAGVTVTAAHLETVMHGTATKVRVQARFNVEGRRAGLPGTFIVKGGFAAHRELMADIYQLETRFYRDVAANLPIQVPKCFYAATDARSGQSIVILEDLDLRRVSFCRVQQPLSFAQVQSQLEALARMHATWWDSPEFSAGGSFAWIEPLDPLPEGEKGAYQRGQLEPAVYAKFMSLPRGVAVARQFHDRDRMEQALERLREIDRAGPRCFLHADYHLGNLFFDADGGPGVLDWQSMRCGTWAHDFTYFLVSALDMAERREWEMPLLRYYLDRLAVNGAPAPGFEQAWEAYTRQIVYGLYYWLVNPIEFQAELNNCAVAPRFALAALDHRTLERLTT